ncbi:MAG: hypothetical protein IKS71_02385 [Bacteroidales bacterium]|nr:hypothetical protein [Bacteroidales bacterium]
MKKIFQFATILAALSLLALSCNKEELSTEQFEDNAVVLQAYGPQPVVRGGLLRFIGSNLDKVVSVTIPADNVITDIEVVASGAHSEIRVTVPKETSEPGFPVLTLKDGTTITGKTALTYSEPITIDEITPAEILPGADLTIKGDYLNLIHEVILADKVKISEEAFKAHDRYTIKVTVPETARTGKVGLGTIDELAIAGSENEKDLLATLNIVESETELVVTTAKGTVAAAPVKAGANATITGTNLKLVKSLKLEGATVTEFTATDTQITFVLPAAVADGDVLMVMASGVEVSAGALTTVVPTVTAVAPTPVKNGAALTITGTDLDLVTGVNLPKAAAQFEATATTITIAEVPEKAQEGDITLSLANGKTLTAAYTLVKPTVTSFSVNPAAAGSPVTVNGTDLDLVAAVTFGGGIKVELPGDATADAFTIAVPTAAENGIFVLNLKNGAEVETDSLYVDKPAGAYIGTMPETLYNPGDMFIVEIENPDHLTGVQVDGVDVNYILNGKMLYFAIPDNAKADSQLTLVSDNGSVTYTMNIDPGTQTAWVIWTGDEDLGSWSNQPYVGEYGFLLNHPEVVPGDVIRFSVVGNADWWQMQIYDGNWKGQVCDPVNSENTPEGVFDLVLTEALIELLNGIDNWGGLFVVQGEGCSIVQVSVIHYIPQETAIWEGNEDLGSWSNQPYVGEFGALTTYNIAAGSKVRFYLTGNADWWQMQIYDGNWKGQLCDPVNSENTPGGVFDLNLTQETIDLLNGLDNWGGLFVVQGEGCSITKVSLVYLVK